MSAAPLTASLPFGLLREMARDCGGIVEEHRKGRKPSVFIQVKIAGEVHRIREFPAEARGAELEADARRLDWIEKHEHGIEFEDEAEAWIVIDWKDDGSGHYVGVKDALRDAIDAAMESGASPPPAEPRE